MQDTETSPDGLIRVEWQFSTGLMSHEINSPRFIDARSGAPFLTLWDEQWDASVRWEGEGRFRLSLRNYGRQGNVEAEVDLPRGTWRAIAPPREAEPLEGIDRSIRNAFAQAEGEAARSTPSASAPAPSGSGLWDIIGFALLALMAGGAWYFFRR